MKTKLSESTDHTVLVQSSDAQIIDLGGCKVINGVGNGRSKYFSFMQLDMFV